MATPDGTAARVCEALAKDPTLSADDLCAILRGTTGRKPNRDTVRKARYRFLNGRGGSGVSLPASRAVGQPLPQPEPPQIRGAVAQAIRDVLAAVETLGVDGVRAILELCGGKQ